MYKIALSLRYLRAKRILFFSIAGVATSVFAIITVLAVMNGFGQHLRARIRGALSDMVVESGGVKGFADYEGIISEIEKIPGVAACSPRLEGVAVFQSRFGERFYSEYFCEFVGIDPRREAEVSLFRKYAGDSSLSPSSREELAQAVVGSELLDAFGAFPGEEIALLCPTTFDDANTRRFVISGAYRSGMYEFDSRFVFIPIEDAQELRNLPGRATSIALRLTDYSKAEEIKREISSLLASRGDFDVSTWEDKREVFLRTLRLEWVLTATIVFFFLVVSAFSIVAILTNVVLQKTSDIGILRSMGASVNGVMATFLLYGGLVGVVGTILGMSLAGLFLRFLDPIEKIVYELTRWTPYPRTVFYIDRIPREISPRTILWIAATAIFMSLIASVYPALRAARVDPVRSIRSLR